MPASTDELDPVARIKGRDRERPRIAHSVGKRGRDEREERMRVPATWLAE
jgi:hypothetical protein